MTMKDFEFILSGNAGLKGQIKAENAQEAEKIILAHMREMLTHFTVRQLIIEEKGENNE